MLLGGYFLHLFLEVVAQAARIRAVQVMAQQLVARMLLPLLLLLLQHNKPWVLCRLGLRQCCSRHSRHWLQPYMEQEREGHHGGEERRRWLCHIAACLAAACLALHANDAPSPNDTTPHRGRCQSWNGCPLCRFRSVCLASRALHAKYQCAGRIPLLLSRPGRRSRRQH